MTKPEVDPFVRKAKVIYACQLRPNLEPDHAGEFVAIEPESGVFFFGKTNNEAALRGAPDPPLSD